MTSTTRFEISMHGLPRAQIIDHGYRNLDTLARCLENPGRLMRMQQSFHACPRSVSSRSLSSKGYCGAVFRIFPIYQARISARKVSYNQRNESFRFISKKSSSAAS